MKNPIKSAAGKQSGQNDVYYYNEPIIKSDKNGKPNYQIVVAGDEAASDYVTLLRHLPELFQDSGSMSEIIGGLLSITAKQQMQISALETKIEEVIRANIAIQAQENINNVLFQLAAEGCDVARPEVVIKIAASMSNASSESVKNEKSATNYSESKREMQGEISGIAKLLTGLKLSAGDDSSLNSQINEILHRTSESKSSKDYTGDVSIRFESISGSPMAKAKAAALKTPSARKVPAKRNV